MNKGLKTIKKVLTAILASERNEKYSPTIYQPEKPKKLKEVRK